MRRLAATCLLLFVSASFLAPAALGAISPVSAHACCMRKAQHHHCGVSQQEPGIFAGMPCGKGCCRCAAFVSQSPVNPEPAWAAVAPADAHPFLDEFFPVSAPVSQPRATSERAPPLTSSR